MSSYILDDHRSNGDGLKETRNDMEKSIENSPDPTAPSAPTSTPQAANSLGFEDFIEASSNAVLRAVGSRKFHETSPLDIPILIGIIFFPGLKGSDLSQGQHSTTASKESADQ